MQVLTGQNSAFLALWGFRAYRGEMNGKAKRRGLMGGTFNPLHHGHLITARWAGELLCLDRVGLMPNTRSPLRLEERMASAELRLEMVRAAVAGEPQLEAEEVEVARGGPSYLVESLEELRRRDPDIVPVFLMGGDSLSSFDRWVRAEEIVELAEVRVLPRPGLDAEAALAALERRRPALRGALTLLPSGPRVDISATEIRDRVKAGRSIRYLVPDPVREIIEREGLYR